MHQGGWSVKRLVCPRGHCIHHSYCEAGSVVQTGWLGRRIERDVLHIKSDTSEWSGLSMEMYFREAILQVTAVGNESGITQSHTRTSMWHKTTLLVEEIHALNWFSHACCQSIVSMTTVNKNSPVYTVNHQGGKTRQSPLLRFPAVCYCIYNAFDSALYGAVKTNAILTTVFGMRVCVCVLLTGVDGNTQAETMFETASKRHFSIKSVCVLRHAHHCVINMCTYSIHALRYLFPVSTEVAGRQQQPCPGLTRMRFAANELIHQQTRVGTRGMMRRRRVRRKMKRDGGAEQGQGCSERSLAVKYDGLGISMLSCTFSCPFWMLRLEDLSSAWSLLVALPKF